MKHGPQPDNWVPTTVMINESFAKKYFAGRNPIGLHVGFGMDPGTKTDMEVIGVVKDIKYTNLRDEIPPQAFLPYLEPLRRRNDGVCADKSGSEATDVGRAAQNASTGWKHSDLRDAHDRRTDRSFAAQRAPGREPVDGLRISRDSARSNRVVWSDGLYRGAANARDRHPHGAGSGTRATSSGW